MRARIRAAAKAGLEQVLEEGWSSTSVRSIGNGRPGTPGSAVLLRATEEWALKRYLDMTALDAMNRTSDKNGDGN